MVSAAVRRAAKNLEVLRSFVWDGEELPPYDDMWFALRISCVGVHVVDALVELKSFFLQLSSTQVYLNLTRLNPTTSKQPRTCNAVQYFSR